jgi:diguanylate cyclase (GGDEF)-like protein
VVASLEGPERSGWIAGVVAGGRPRATAVELLLGRARRLWVRLVSVRAAIGDERTRLGDLLSAAADFLWEADAELRIVRLVEAARASPGRSLPDLLGRRWSDLPAEGGDAGPDPCALLAPRHTRPAIAPGQPFRDLRCSFTDAAGEARTLEASGVPFLDRHGRLLGYRGTAREVSERVRIEQRLRYLAGHDSLTGAANRRLLEAALGRAVEAAAGSGCRVALVTVDLAGFMQVTDAFGHVAGDAVLCALVRRLREGLAAQDLVARLGGDEFAVLLGAVDDPQTLGPRLAAIRDRLAEPVAVEGGTVSLSASCGVAVWPEQGRGLDDLLRRADAEMYRAKWSRRQPTGAGRPLAGRLLATG